MPLPPRRLAHRLQPPPAHVHVSLSNRIQASNSSAPYIGAVVPTYMRYAVALLPAVTYPPPVRPRSAPPCRYRLSPVSSGAAAARSPPRGRSAVLAPSVVPRTAQARGSPRS